MHPLTELIDARQFRRAMRRGIALQKHFVQICSRHFRSRSFGQRRRITQTPGGSRLLNPLAGGLCQPRMLSGFGTNALPFSILSIFRRFEFGEFFFGIGDVGSVGATELQQSLLTTQVRFGKFKLGALALCYCFLLGFDQFG